MAGRDSRCKAGGRRAGMEESRSRWGDRTSNPGGAVRRSQVGSTPILHRHLPGIEVEGQAPAREYRNRPGRVWLAAAVRDRNIEKLAHLAPQAGIIGGGAS